jgi:predicted nuclease with TOPRIM domain
VRRGLGRDHALGLAGAELRNVQKEIAALERALTKIAAKVDATHVALADHDQSDHVGIARLTGELRKLEAELADTENRWIELSESIE